jgi:hypothetical protein
MAVTLEDVEDLSSVAWTQLTDNKKQSLLDMAERTINNQLSERHATFDTVEGDRDDAIRLLAAHKWELAEGGEAQSESSQGGNVSYNTVTGEWQASLSETRYGRMLSDLYLRDRQGLAIVIS